MQLLMAPLLGGFAAWGLLTGASRLVRLAPDWPLWAVAVGVALAGGLIGWLYRYEQGAVVVSRARILLALRLTALAVLVWILLEPTLVRTIEREISQEVVVVLDDSASMHLIDDGMDESRIELGEGALAGAGLVESLLGSLLLLIFLFTIPIASFTF